MMMVVAAVELKQFCYSEGYSYGGGNRERDGENMMMVMKCVRKKNVTL